MDRRTMLFGTAAAAASTAVGAPVSASSIGSDGDPALVRLHEAMATRVARGELVGIVYAVARHGTVHVDTIGRLSLEDDQPMRRSTPFRVASLTKPIIAAATMMLVEDGRLALDEPIDRLLPELAHRRVLTRIDAPLDQTVPAQRPITVEDLLTLRMGYGMIFEPSFEPPYPVIKAANDLQLVMAQPDPRTPWRPHEWIRRFGTLPLMDQPGERWRYNAGMLVLGVLVARASGRGLGDFLDERIFQPLGMRRTGFWLPAAQAAALPGLYLTNQQTGKLELQQGSRPQEWSRPPAFASGAAGLASTVDDYLAFSQLLLNKGVYRHRRLLSAESIELLTTNHLTPQQRADAGPAPLNGRGWGYGMAVSVAPDEVSEPGRYGWEGGYGTAWFNDPHRDLTAIAMTQTIDFLFNGGADEFQHLAARV